MSDDVFLHNRVTELEATVDELLGGGTKTAEVLTSIVKQVDFLVGLISTVSAMNDSLIKRVEKLEAKAGKTDTSGMSVAYGLPLKG